MFDSVIAIIVFVTAIINIIAVLLVLFTCRFAMSLKMSDRYSHRGWYKALYKFHSYIWWIIIPSLFIHASLALYSAISGP
jgi:hypothetical protein